MLPESIDPEVRSRATTAFLASPSARTLATMSHLASLPRWSAFLHPSVKEEDRWERKLEGTPALLLVSCAPPDEIPIVDLTSAPLEQAVMNLGGAAWGRRTIDPHWNAEGRLAIDNDPPRNVMLFGRCGLVVGALTRALRTGAVYIGELERGVLGTALAWEGVFGPLAGSGPAHLDVSLVGAQGFTVKKHEMDKVTEVDRPHIHLTFELSRSEERIDRRLRPFMDVLAQALGKPKAGYDDGGDWPSWVHKFGDFL